MKKIMIAILFLIPLIIIMSVNVSGMIISATVKISVESIILKNRGEYIDDVYINFNEYNDVNKYYKIDTVCYPKLAQVHLLWESSDEGIARVEDGKVYFTGYGEVTISALSFDNININARCNFYVSGDTIYSIDIIEYGQEDIQENINMAVYERKLLDKIIIPSNALKDKIISWSSSNNNIATIDDNGVITANSTGVTNITITIMEDDKVNSDSITVNVLPSNTILKKDELYISGNTVNISDFTTSNDYSITVLSGDGELIGKELNYTGSGVGEVLLQLNYYGVISELIVNFTDGNYLLGFKNLDVLQKTAWGKGNIIWAGSANTVLTPIVLNDDYAGAIPVIQYSSSDHDTLTVHNGRLYALDGGTADITISAEGFIDGVLAMKVLLPMESVSLSYDKADDIRGIEGVRVFGIKTYHYDENEVGYIDNTLKLKVNSFRPLEAEQIYDYSSSNMEYATVDEDGIITFLPAGIGHSVYIYITARYSVSAKPVNDYYEFQLVDGVNVGLDVNSSENNDLTPNFDTYAVIKEILQNNTTPNNVVMHANIYVPIAADGGGGYTAYGSIFGNGYKYDAQFLVKDFSTANINVDFNFISQELEFRNVTFNSAYPTDDFMVYKENGGTFFTVGNDDSIVGDKKLIMKYCCIQYSFSNVYLAGGNVIFDGCVLRNTAGPTINVQSDPNRAPNVTIKNCIFSNIIAPIVTMYTYFDLNNTEPLDKYATLNLLGTNYVYNWKEIQNIQVDIIPSGSLPNGYADIFNAQINKTVRQELKQAKFDEIKVEGKDPLTGFNKTYINFSILIIGVWRDASAFNLNYDDEEFKNIEIDVSETDIGAILGAGLNKSCYLLTSNNNLTAPNETYDLNEITLKRLRGEA